ncbi:hypothetical protein SPRG_05475 [Saprolegnia parasitica CBS 223.65]|uniref:PX domain-containing protein n=1 Tax=Saprolegnia parasitica (strain CBS 223.65) TaxID=695850 RepID=A0A067CG77_SAPPC|nr:hypothetical protein SPRG_05475 [Saprolegnia parasitica CBS 223.65]KDO29518.1 hypothetical protein SPRG_05475 [Saprolegnia parasitica CBS 223.65]|eukprot:XP_012199584.1 hypothetical protein SPRG_05475 [Saprolegnia parasitica CBS 223.65]
MTTDRHLRITKHSPSKTRPASNGHIQFHILVEELVPSGRRHKEYVICKRFKQFEALRTELSKAGFATPSLPMTGPAMSLWMVWNKDEALLHRAMNLQRFLDVINASELMQASAAFRAFVGESPDQKRGYTSLSGYSTTSEASFACHDLSRSSSLSLLERRRQSV